jgi:glycosyltransferase involved in cell wall biosynthesis
MPSFRPCVLIPTYDNPATIQAVVEQARLYLADVIVVDDGSHAPGREACERLARAGLATVHRCPENGGKGAAVKASFALAQQLGFSHAVQVDGDGQHDLGQIPRFLALAESRPEALILGTPVYDHTLHRGRYIARLVTRFWNYLEVLGPTIGDSMCGFRVYPIGAALASGTRGNRMDFDIEIPVRMVWQRVPVVNAEVRVRYLTPEEGGVSHYHTFRDTLLISWAHSKLMTEIIFRLLTWPARRLLGLTP